MVNMEMNTLQTIQIIFQNRISDKEVPYFRGAILNKYKNNILFHNHNTDFFRNLYPLIQYKKINGYAAIVGINEGIEALEELASTEKFSCNLGYKNYNMIIGSINSDTISISEEASLINYRIRKWLPLNQENYLKYKNTTSLTDRIKILEDILIGNIISFAKGVHIHMEHPIICKLTNIDNQSIVPYKEVELISLDATFQSNILLPENIGLGKGASINHGNICRIYKKKIV